MREIKIDEGEDLDVFLRYKRRVPGGNDTTAFSLVGVGAISLVVKPTLAGDDVANDLFTYTMAAGDIIVTNDGSGGAEFSEIKVKTKGVDQLVPGNYYYKVKVTINGRTETIDKGIWRVENT
jgi:hypothetical protein